MKAQVLRVAHQALHDPPRHFRALPSFALGLPHRNGSQESQPGTGPSLAFRGTRPADDDLGAAPWPEAYRQQAAGQGLAPGCWAHKVTLDHGEGPSSVSTKGLRCGWDEERGSPALTVPTPPPGLNVHSMLKHQTLVLTLPTIAFLEDKLLWQDSRYKPLYPFSLPYSNFP